MNVGSRQIFWKNTGGSSGGSTKARYVKFTIYKSGLVQCNEWEFIDSNGNAFVYPDNMPFTYSGLSKNSGGNANTEWLDGMVDNGLAGQEGKNKYYGSCSGTGWVIYDLGSNCLDINKFNRYRLWNDDCYTYGRGFESWDVEVSTDGVFFVMLDQQRNATVNQQNGAIRFTSDPFSSTISDMVLKSKVNYLGLYFQTANSASEVYFELGRLQLKDKNGITLNLYDGSSYIGYGYGSTYETAGNGCQYRNHANDTERPNICMSNDDTALIGFDGQPGSSKLPFLAPFKLANPINVSAGLLYTQRTGRNTSLSYRKINTFSLVGSVDGIEWHSLYEYTSTPPNQDQYPIFTDQPLHICMKSLDFSQFVKTLS